MAYSNWGKELEKSIYDGQNLNRQLFDEIPLTHRHEIPPEMPHYSPYSYVPSFGLPPPMPPYATQNFTYTPNTHPPPPQNPHISTYQPTPTHVIYIPDQTYLQQEHNPHATSPPPPSNHSPSQVSQPSHFPSVTQYENHNPRPLMPNSSQPTSTYPYLHHTTIPASFPPFEPPFFSSPPPQDGNLSFTNTHWQPPFKNNPSTPLSSHIHDHSSAQPPVPLQPEPLITHHWTQVPSQDPTQVPPSHILNNPHYLSSYTYSYPTVPLPTHHQQSLNSLQCCNISPHQVHSPNFVTPYQPLHTPTFVHSHHHLNQPPPSSQPHWPPPLSINQSQTHSTTKVLTQFQTFLEICTTPTSSSPLISDIPPIPYPQVPSNNWEETSLSPTPPHQPLFHNQLSTPHYNHHENLQPFSTSQPQTTPLNSHEPHFPPYLSKVHPANNCTMLAPLLSRRLEKPIPTYKNTSLQGGSNKLNFSKPHGEKSNEGQVIHVCKKPPLNTMDSLRSSTSESEVMGRVVEKEVQQNKNLTNQSIKTLPDITLQALMGITTTPSFKIEASTHGQEAITIKGEATKGELWTSIIRKDTKPKEQGLSCFELITDYFQIVRMQGVWEDKLNCLRCISKGVCYLDTGQVLKERTCSENRLQEDLVSLIQMLLKVHYFDCHPMVKSCFKEEDGTDPTTLVMLAANEYVQNNIHVFKNVGARPFPCQNRLSAYEEEFWSSIQARFSYLSACTSYRSGKGMQDNLFSLLHPPQYVFKEYMNTKVVLIKGEILQGNKAQSLQEEGAGQYKDKCSDVLTISVGDCEHMKWLTCKLWKKTFDPGGILFNSQAIRQHTLVRKEVGSNLVLHLW